MKTKKLTRLAVLTAIASVIFIIELQFPDLIPIAGVKAGLANVVTVYTLYAYGLGDVILVTLCRILIGSLFSGNISAVIYSLAGAFFSIAIMAFLRKIVPEKYVWLCSAAGGIFHNTGQTVAAITVMGTAAVVSYLPFLICSGCIAGIFTGLCAGFALSRKKDLQ